MYVALCSMKIKIKSQLMKYWQLSVGGLLLLPVLYSDMEMFIQIRPWSTCSGKRFQGLSLWGRLDLGPLEREGASEGTTLLLYHLEKNPTKLASNKMLNVSPLQPTHKKRCDPKYYIAVSTVEDETNCPTYLAIYPTFFSLGRIGETFTFLFFLP